MVAGTTGGQKYGKEIKIQVSKSGTKQTSKQFDVCPSFGSSEDGY